MSNTCNSLLVIFKKPIKEEQMEALKNAILLFSDVLDVKSHWNSIEATIADSRAKHELASAILDVVYPDRKKSNG